MKKIILAVSMLFALNSSSQVISTNELQEYTISQFNVEKGKWKECAMELVNNGTVALDKNNSLTWVEVIDCGEATKEQLYEIINYWFMLTFNDEKSSIKKNDKDAGTIIAQAYLHDIAKHTSLTNNYSISIRPVIKVDIKDKKARITYTLQTFEAEKETLMSKIPAISLGKSNDDGNSKAASVGGGDRQKETKALVWNIVDSYPFVEKPGNKAPLVTSKALLMGVAYSFVVMDKFKEAVKNGLDGNGNENDDDW